MIGGDQDTEAGCHPRWRLFLRAIMPNVNLIPMNPSPPTTPWIREPDDGPFIERFGEDSSLPRRAPPALRNDLRRNRGQESLRPLGQLAAERGAKPPARPSPGDAPRLVARARGPPRRAQSRTGPPRPGGE